MKCAYFDCIAGASGDMILGALFDSGLDRQAWEAGMSALALPGWSIRTEPVRRGSIGATQVIVQLTEPSPAERRLPDILALLQDSRLPPGVREKGRHIFERLAEAEARVHRISPQDVHFHEVGAADAVVDIIGSILGLELLGVEQILVSTFPVARGWVETRHGSLPLPAPAVLELLQGWPVEGREGETETITPTGAAILTTLGQAAPVFPAMAVARVGYGAGTRATSVPNVLRLVLGQALSGGFTQQQIVVLETNIDDMNPQVYPTVMVELMALGAVDAFLTQTIMKSGRPGTQVTVLCPLDKEIACAEQLLEHTTTLGLRRQVVARYCLERRMVELRTPYGTLQGKAACRDGRILRVAPEYEDCLRLAQERDVPVTEVYRAAVAAGFSAPGPI